MKKILKKILPKHIIGVLNSIRNGNYNYIYWLLPIKRDKIVICSYYGRGYGDNAKYIVNELIKRKSNLDIVWLITKDGQASINVPNNVRFVRYGSQKALYELSTAKIWIDNSRKSLYPPKKKNQYYIQTWHSSAGLKRIEGDAIEYLPHEYIYMAKRDSKITDIMVSGTEFNSKRYRRAFWFDKEILNIGTPRNDLLIENSQKLISDIKRQLKLSNNKKVLLYAPTFRTKYQFNYNELEVEMLQKILKRKFGSDWTILIRHHPNLRKENEYTKQEKLIINVSNYDDMQELLLIADCVITDYSSLMFDYSLTRKPCFLFVPDLLDYYEHERGLNYKVEDLPFPYALNMGVLIENINKFNQKEYENKIDLFLDKLGSFENGQSSQKLANRIEKLILN